MRDSKRLVLECEKIEVIDGVLYHEDAADSARWCVIVSKHLRGTLCLQKLILLFLVDIYLNRRCMTNFAATTGGME